MQLYRPPARWRAAVYDPRYQVSATLDTLPPSLPLFCTRISPNWYHVVVRDGIDYGELALAYAHADLPPWIGPRVFAVLGVVSPAVDLDAYHRTRWWGLDWPINPTSARLLEEVGGDLVTKWHHAWMN